MHRHLIIGPLPPPDGGTTLLFKQLVDSLNLCDEIDLVIIDSNKGKNRLAKFKTILAGIFFNIRKCDSIAFHCSTPLFRFLLPLVFIFSFVLKKPLIIRKFGGDYFNYLDGNISFYDLIIIFILKKIKYSLFETKREIELLENKFRVVNCIWYPNSRLKISKMKNSFSNKELKLCFLGTVSREKGIDTLLEALDCLNNNDIHVNIYGPCKDHKLLHLIDKNKFASYKSTFKSDELSNIFSHHDILCLPTRYKGEGYPGVIIESYAVGLPVIVSDWQAIPEIVKDGEQGLIFDGSVSGLVKCINRVYTDRTLLNMFSKNALKSFDIFDSNKLLDRYKTILVEIKNGL